MKYYKVIIDNQIVSVANTYCFRNLQKKNNLILYSEKSAASFLQAENGEFYRDYWMEPLLTEKISCQQAEIKEISEEEYESLKVVLFEGEEIVSIEEQEIKTNFKNEQNVLDFAEKKKLKIKELSLYCKKNIQQGFDVFLSDKKSHHFSLELVDQMNIASLHARAEEGETFLPYHGDEEECRIFSKEDINIIYNKMQETIIYHTIYYNSLKNYVYNIKNENTLMDIKYGDKVPFEYQSDVLRTLI